MLHGNLSQIPFTFALGLFLAYMTVYTGSVVPAMIVHGVNNSLSVLISMLSVNTSGLTLTQVLVTVLYYGTLLLVGLLGLIIFIHSSKDPLTISKERSDDVKTVAAYYFSSPGFIVFAIMTFISILDVQYNLIGRIFQ